MIYHLGSDIRGPTRCIRTRRGVRRDDYHSRRGDATVGITVSFKYLHNIGYLGDRTLLGLCTQASDRDVRLLADGDVRVLHNLLSNLTLGDGFTPVPRMLDVASLS